MNKPGSRQGHASQQQQQHRTVPNAPGSKLYQTIMTPINFITFILSLWLVSDSYQRQRVAMHDDNCQSNHNYKSIFSLPQCVHRLMYKPQPYTYIDGQAGNPPNENDERFYYHTKQRKIMKLEAADAFELRSSVLGALCVAGVLAVWGFVMFVRVLGGLWLAKGGFILGVSE